MEIKPKDADFKGNTLQQECQNSTPASPIDELGGHKKQGIEPEILKRMKEDPQIIREVQQTVLSVMKSGPGFPPFFDKVDGKHITQALGVMEKELDYSHQDRKYTKWFTPGYVVIGVIIFSFLTVFFVRTNNIDLLKEIITIGGSFILGGFGGYGLCEVRRGRK